MLDRISSYFPTTPLRGLCKGCVETLRLLVGKIERVCRALFQSICPCWFGPSPFNSQEMVDIRSGGVETSPGCFSELLDEGDDSSVPEDFITHVESDEASRKAADAELLEESPVHGNQEEPLKTGSSESRVRRGFSGRPTFGSAPLQGLLYSEIDLGGLIHSRRVGSREYLDMAFVGRVEPSSQLPLKQSLDATDLRELHDWIEDESNSEERPSSVRPHQFSSPAALNDYFSEGGSDTDFWRLPIQRRDLNEEGGNSEDDKEKISTRDG